jgi:hypothetical protein
MAHGHRSDYTVRFADRVAGLEVSAQVKFQGLRVGRVDAMRIDPTDPKRVEVTLSLEAGTALYEGTRAALEMSGITGLKIINLTPGDPRLPKLAVGAEILPSQSFFERITGQAEAIVLKVETVVGNLAAWTGPETRGKVTDVLVERLGSGDREQAARECTESIADMIATEATKAGALPAEEVHEAREQIARTIREWAERNNPRTDGEEAGS